MNKNMIMRVIYEQKDYSLAEKLCEERQDDESLLMLARVLFYEKKYANAEMLFKKLHKFVEYGYCKLFQGEKRAADMIWNSLEDTSPLIMWAKALSGYLDKKQTRIPTFFQIRNFYECDLDTLMSLKFLKYSENLINSIQYFADINPEVYKFTGRVLLNHGYLDLAEKFLQAGKDVVFDDTELHFLFAELRMAQNQRPAAIKSLETVLEISPTYYPARKLLANIK